MIFNGKTHLEMRTTGSQRASLNRSCSTLEVPLCSFVFPALALYSVLLAWHTTKSRPHTCKEKGAQWGVSLNWGGGWRGVVFLLDFSNIVTFYGCIFHPRSPKRQKKSIKIISNYSQNKGTSILPWYYFFLNHDFFSPQHFLYFFFARSYFSLPVFRM